MKLLLGVFYFLSASSAWAQTSVREVLDERLSHISDRTRDAIERTIHSESGSIDPLLVLAVIEKESMFKMRTTSKRNCSGLMQLHPQTFLMFSKGSIFDPVENVKAGTRYLLQMIRMFGSISDGLMAYNGGPGNLKRWKKKGHVPLQVKGYASHVFSIYSNLVVK